MNRTLKYVDKINDLVGQVVSISIVLMVISVVLEITVRLVTGRPLNWTYETSQFLFGGYIILLGGYAYLHGTHVRMDFFYGRMSKKMQAVMDLLTFPFFLIFVGVFLWLSWGWAVEAWKYNERSQTMWGPILFPIKMTVPIGFFLLMISGISHFIKNLQCLFDSGKEG